MKKILSTALLAIAVMTTTDIYAQTKKDTTLGQKIDKTANKVGNATSTAAKKVGNKTAELASKGAAAVTDKRYEGHWAPTGELVYIDEYGKYFYVNKKGKRVFITKAEMRTTKPAK
ncbi:hypothetical protein [Mucilaginibacter auburnensis]|uniref:Uncharacterized protein n=1 Tax=Mucilaginibacter auburnensis TaxID=1457233 RepID=A0A2H9VQ01_9SPHI|nr:hypothetical protein [Mucilaginibacter auburnensis]PJJ80429.1 hypothetical protein CLV57_3580 [Mucilaginibacter auburnensis]